MVALEAAREAGIRDSADSWALQRTLVEDLAQHWKQPDNGIWEIRGEQQHFTHSRVMVWAAFDRAVAAVERHGLDGPVERWRALREEVRQEVLTHGYDSERGTFTQHYGTKEVDASLLLIPTVGFLPPDDPRVLGTIRGGGGGPDARGAAAALPHRQRRGRADRRRAPVPRLLVLAGVRVRRCRARRRRPTR